MKNSIALDQIRIASPCPMSWKDMEGDERVRFCHQCERHVYNVSAMSQSEAEALIHETEGRLCVEYRQRVDGTILTQDCPVGIRAARKAATRLVGFAVGACVLLVTVVSVLAGGARGASRARLSEVQPFRGVLQRFSPVPVRTFRGEAAFRAPVKASPLPLVGPRGGKGVGTR